ncbi:tyrosine-type recombinase/integrase [uncultured Traorella sp.]|uniref:site-specific integrase n=1 Tax=uncultured Traorella sp. TaxID=1929048 RepID=UPI0025CF3AB3|nr:tyrosine-type recombinase/integrase [uncultured Traorella sp.]
MKNKKTGKKKVSGYIKEINGIWHIVIVYYDAQGKRKFSSVSTKLKVKGNKRNATRLMENILDLFEIPNEGDKLNLKKYLNSDLEKNKAKLDKIKTKKKGKQNKDETKKYIPISSDMLFADFLYFWLKAVKSSIALNTYGTYYMTVNSKIAPYFRERNIKLNELSTIDLQNYYSYEEEVERLSPNTILKRHNNINQALKYAINLELIEKNPADRVIKPKKVKFTGGSSYSQEELTELFKIFKGDPLEIAVYFAAYYGLRREEIVGIKWKNIDFENHTLTIRSVVTNGLINGKVIEIERDNPKNTSSERTFPLVKLFEDLLIKMKANQEKNKRIAGRSYNPRYMDYIYVDKLGNRIKPGYITQHFNQYLKKHGARHIRFHDLRHTCATLMLAKGENLVKVQKWLGHSDISTTANIYSHLDFQSKVDSANNLLNIMPDSLI